jgi:hypothetical protein
MILQVVVGAILIVLGLCALLGLPALTFHLYRRDVRSHAFEQVVVADIHEVENKIAHAYEDEVERVRPAHNATESGVAYQ